MPPLLNIFYGVIGLGVSGCALFGWGRQIRRCTALPSGSWPVSVVLGLAWVIFLGGLLNLCHLAFPQTLDLLLVAGLGLAVFEWRGVRFKNLWPEDRADRRYRIIFAGLALAIMGFTIITQLAPRYYSPDDDLRKYFAHVARMIQTGTLRGSPLNALGSETFGGQAFLQGFVAGHFPIQYINGMDAVFCFGLCLALAGGIAWKRPNLGVGAIVGVIAVFFIHPQSINISSLYSTAALLMGLIFLNLDPREHLTEKHPAWRSAIPAALIIAGVLALKPTGVLFLALQLFLSTIVTLRLTRDWQPVLKSVLLTVFWAGVFLLPWVLLFAPEQIAGWLHPLPAASTPIPLVSETINLLSPEKRPYGSSYLAYTSVAIFLCGCALSFFFTRNKDEASRRLAFGLAATCAAAVAAFLVINVGGLYLVESDGALRYSIPTLIGITPAAFGLGAICWEGRKTWLALVSGVILFVLFLPATRQRFDLLANHHTQVAYVPNFKPEAFSDLQSFEDNLLQGALSDRIRRLQQKIPPGKSIVAWVDAPFQLDFRRNPIFDINDSGLGTGWSRMPDADYVLWEKDGFDVTPRYYYFFSPETLRKTDGFGHGQVPGFSESTRPT